MTPNYMGGNNENDIVSSPETVSIHFKDLGNDLHVVYLHIPTLPSDEASKRSRYSVCIEAYRYNPNNRSGSNKRPLPLSRK